MSVDPSERHFGALHLLENAERDLGRAFAAMLERLDEYTVRDLFRRYATLGNEGCALDAWVRLQDARRTYRAVFNHPGSRPGDL